MVGWRGRAGHVSLLLLCLLWLAGEGVLGTLRCRRRRSIHLANQPLPSHQPACREYHGHAKGVLGMSWCPQDATFLLSSAKDNRTICWDVNSGTHGCLWNGAVGGRGGAV